ncbi:tetratricopeptide repeat protein [Lysobacter cavernae]|uniref:Tetratricopeptide repeat protein n=1 Tax=Lysobacter cavernae TaxID=1685901 RepID=A0ABV7RSQ8_9GAMM
MKRHLLLAGLLAVAGPAAAQTLPKPVEFYFAADASATKPVQAIKDSGDAAMEKLAKAIERNPRAKAEVAQLAHLAMEAGRADLGRQLYGRALATIDRSDGIWRSVAWNYGWDLYRAGDSEGALAQWRTLLESRNIAAAWMPPTFALVLWSLDRKDEAVQWYAAAVRSEPQQWSSSAGLTTLLPDWSEGERAALAEVQAAWAQNPPSWP